MKFRLDFPASPLGPVASVEFEDFSPEVWGLFDDFLAFSDAAHRTRFARELVTYRTSFHFTNDGKVLNTGVVPDDEAIAAFLHRYRPIILHKEPTAFTNVCAVLERGVGCGRFSQIARQWKAQYAGKPLRELCRVTQGDLVLTSQSFLDAYLNAFEYHRDKRRIAQLSPFAAAFEPEARRGLVTLLLKYKFCAVSSLRIAIRKLRALRERRGSDAQYPAATRLTGQES